MIERLYIQPNDLRNWWQWVRVGLEVIKRKSTEPWIPEDVYTDCYTQRSMLWVFKMNNRPVGFVVLQPVADTIHVWCAYAYEDGIVDECWAHTIEIAQSGDAKQITFDSNRRGWERMAKKLNFRPRRWVREL
jgi:hypothetical protein